MTNEIKQFTCSNCGAKVNEAKRWYHADQDDMVCLACAEKLEHTDTAYAGTSVAKMEVEKIECVKEDKIKIEFEYNCYFCGKQMEGKGVGYQGTYFCNDKCIKEFDEKIKTKLAKPKLFETTTELKKKGIIAQDLFADIKDYTTKEVKKDISGVWD